MASARAPMTARKSLALLNKSANEAKVPLTVLFIGPGWATRSEVSELARATQGAIFTEESIPEAVRCLIKKSLR